MSKKISKENGQQSPIMLLEQLITVASNYISNHDQSLLESIKILASKLEDNLEQVRNKLPNKKWINLVLTLRFIASNLNLSHNVDGVLKTLITSCTSTYNRLVHNNINTNDIEVKLRNARQLTLAYAKTKHLIVAIRNHIDSLEDKDEIKLYSSSLDNYNSKLTSIQLSLVNILLANEDVKVEHLTLDPKTLEMEVDVVKVLKHFDNKGGYNA